MQAQTVFDTRYPTSSGIPVMEKPNETVCNSAAPRVGITAPIHARGHLIGAGSSATNYYRVEIDENNTYRFHLMNGQQQVENNSELVKTNPCKNPGKIYTQYGMPRVPYPMQEVPMPVCRGN